MWVPVPQPAPLYQAVPVSRIAPAVKQLVGRSSQLPSPPAQNVRQESTHWMSRFDIEPRFVSYSNRDQRALSRVVNNPGEGLCGWAAMALSIHGNFARVQDIRQRTLDFIRETGLVQIRLLLSEHAWLSVVDDHDGIRLEAPILEADLLQLENTLQTDAGVQGDVAGAFAADMTLVGAAVAALAHARRLVVYQSYNGQPGTQAFTMNYPSSLPEILLHRSGSDTVGHFEALREGAVAGSRHLRDSGHATDTDLLGVDHDDLDGDLPVIDQADTDGLQLDTDPPGSYIRLAHTDIDRLLNLVNHISPFSVSPVLSPIDLLPLEPCPEGSMYVRVIRFSACQNQDETFWTDYINAQRVSTFIYIQAIDPLVTMQQIAIIVVQRSALSGIEAFFDEQCDVTLPVMSRPSSLVRLIAEYAIKRLILTSGDGLLVDPGALHHLLMGDGGDLNGLHYECIPDFVIDVHPLYEDTIDNEDFPSYEFGARALILHIADPGSHPHREASKFYTDMRHGLLKRRLQGVGSVLGSRDRNSVSSTDTFQDGEKVVHHELLSTQAENLSHLETDLEVLLKIHPASGIGFESLPSPMQVAAPAGRHFRGVHAIVVRFSNWSKQFGASVDTRDPSTYAQNQLLQHRKGISGVWQDGDSQLFVAFGGSTLSTFDDLLSAPSYPDGAIRDLIDSIAAGRVVSLSVPSADTLLSTPSELQLLLLGGTPHSTPRDYLVFIGDLRRGMRMTTARTIARQLASDAVPTFVQEESSGLDTAAVAVTFARSLRMGRLARLCLCVGSSVGGRIGRNRLRRHALRPAPLSSYDIVRLTGRTDGYRCNVHNCGYTTRSKHDHDRHHHAEHSGLREHACDYCALRQPPRSESFTTRQELHRHISRHHQCGCGQTFSHRPALREHTESQVCQSAWDRRDRQRAGFRRTYQCLTCHRRWATLGRLRGHRRLLSANGQTHDIGPFADDVPVSLTSRQLPDGRSAPPSRVTPKERRRWNKATLIGSDAVNSKVPTASSSSGQQSALQIIRGPNDKQRSVQTVKQLVDLIRSEWWQIPAKLVVNGRNHQNGHVLFAMPGNGICLPGQPLRARVQKRSKSSDSGTVEEGKFRRFVFKVVTANLQRVLGKREEFVTEDGIVCRACLRKDSEHPGHFVLFLVLQIPNTDQMELRQWSPVLRLRTAETVRPTTRGGPRLTNVLWYEAAAVQLSQYATPIFAYLDSIGISFPDPQHGLRPETNENASTEHVDAKMTEDTD